MSSKWNWHHRTVPLHDERTVECPACVHGKIRVTPCKHCDSTGTIDWDREEEVRLKAQHDSEVMIG